MRRHGHRGVGQCSEGRDILLQLLRVGIYHGQRFVTVHRRAAMARNMLHDAADPGVCQTVQHRAAQRGHLHRLRAQRAIPDHVMGAGLAHIEQRQTVDGNTGLGQ